MALGTFYAVVAATCFALVGLWWNVVERHPAWHVDAVLRRRAGGIYLSFLLPGMMAVLAEIDPTTPAIWRISFLVASAIGVWASLSLLRTPSAGSGGWFSQHSWVLGALYGLVAVLSVAPGLAGLIGLRPLQVGGLLLVLLIAAAHALTWELMLQRDQ